MGILLVRCKTNLGQHFGLKPVGMTIHAGRLRRSSAWRALTNARGSHAVLAVTQNIAGRYPDEAPKEQGGLQAVSPRFLGVNRLFTSWLRAAVAHHSDTARAMRSGRVCGDVRTEVWECMGTASERSSGHARGERVMCASDSASGCCDLCVEFW